MTPKLTEPSVARGVRVAAMHPIGALGVYDLRCRTYRIRRDDIDSEAVGRILQKQGDETKPIP